jgi:hypothetical protein
MEPLLPREWCSLFYFFVCFVYTSFRQMTIVSLFKWNMLRLLHRRDYIVKRAPIFIYRCVGESGDFGTLFFLVRRHWGGCRYRHFAANFKGVLVVIEPWTGAQRLFAVKALYKKKR